MIRRLDLLLSSIERLMMLGLTILGVTLGIIQVVMRYIFNSGYHWLETTMIVSLIWAILFGASRAVRQGYHPRVDLLFFVVPAPARAILNILSYGFTLLLCLYYAYDSLFYARFLNMIGVINQETGIPEVYFFIIIPIVMVFFILRYLLLFFALDIILV